MSIAARRLQRTSKHQATPTPPPPPPVTPSTFNPGAVPIGTANYTVPANAIFVAPSGSDSGGNGSMGAPYATLRHALRRAPAGSTVVARAGVYHEGAPQYTGLNVGAGGSGLVRQLHPAAPDITLQNYPGEAVWVDGATPVTNWTADTRAVAGRTVWRAPWQMTVNRAPTEVYGEGNSAQYGTFLLAEFPTAHWPEMVLYDGRQLRQVKSLSEVTEGTFFVEGSPGSGSARPNDFTSTHYVIGSNPAGHEVKISEYARFIGVSQPRFTMRGIGIRNFNCAMPDWGTIYVGRNNCDGFTMENCIVSDISTRGLQMLSTGAKVRKSSFVRCGQIGIGNGADDHTIEHVLFEECNNRRFNYGPDAGGMKTGRCQRGVIRYNWFKKTFGHACWLDEVAYQTIIHGNLFTDTYGNGVMVEISDSNLVVDNIFVNNGVLSTDVATRQPHHGQAIRVSGSNRTQIWHNTFVMCEVPLRINQDPRRPYASGSFGWDPRFQRPWYDANCTWDITSCVVKNNAFLGSTGLNSVQSCFNSTGDGNQGNDKPMAQLGMKFAGNLYARQASNKPTRFALGYPDGRQVKIYTSMTNTGSGTYEPRKPWREEVGEQGSVLATIANPLSNGSTYQIAQSSLSGISAAAPPPEVQALLDASLFNRQTIGAGHL